MKASLLMQIGMQRRTLEEVRTAAMKKVVLVARIAQAMAHATIKGQQAMAQGTTKAPLMVTIKVNQASAAIKAMLATGRRNAKKKHPRWPFLVRR